MTPAHQASDLHGFFIGLNAVTAATYCALFRDQTTMLSFIKSYFERRKLERMRTVLRPGETVSRFIAKDVKREVFVVSNDEIDAGFVTVKIQTNNILYLRGGLAKESEFGPPERVAIDDLWHWTGKSWGGLADGTSIVDHIEIEPELNQTSDNHAVNRSGEVERS